MKRRLFLPAMLIAVSLYSYGQELVPVQCPQNLANTRHGFKDKNSGEIVIPCGFYQVWNFSEHIEGLAKVVKNTTPNAVQASLKYGFIDKTGKEVIPLKYDEIYQFSEFLTDLAMVRVNGKYGFINKTGNEVIPAKYSNSKFIFSEGLAVVMVGNLYGYIDKSGKEVISCGFSFAENFRNGLARVKVDRDDGYIDVAGTFYRGSIEKASKTVSTKKANGDYDAILAQIADAEKRMAETAAKDAQEKAERERLAREEEAKKHTFSNFAQKYVEEKINVWQKKDEFETTADWQERVNENTRKAKADELTEDARKAYIKEYSKNFKIGDMTLGEYDANNEVFPVKNSIHGDWLVPVNRTEAPAFKNNWNNLVKKPQYFIENDQLAISEMSFTDANGNTYKYSNEAILNYTAVDIAYDFAPIELNVTPQTRPQGKQNISTTNISVGNLSDVATNIPTTNVKNDKTFAVIIANENYRRESKVEFAQNDGETFRKYCIQTLGLPETNVHYIPDATLNEIRGEINWLSDIANAYQDEASIIFYYAGHGIPDESTRTAYLLPVDGFGTDLRSGYKLDRLYETLGKMPVKSVTVFMDACFSGAQRGDGMMASARGVAIKTAQGAPTGNMVVFSAAQGDETAFPYREKGHGMFTYFLLKKLQETQGDITLGELGDYITKQVGQQSVVVNRKSQTPTVTSSEAMESKWQGMRLLGR